MTHRGRMDLLNILMDKNLENIFYDFKGDSPDSDIDTIIEGDVKYHLGITTKKIINGK